MVEITVLDVNNNHPVFGQEEYVVSVPEDTKIGEYFVCRDCRVPRLNRLTLKQIVQDGLGDDCCKVRIRRIAQPTTAQNATGRSQPFTESFWLAV